MGRYEAPKEPPATERWLGGPWTPRSLQVRETFRGPAILRFIGRQSPGRKKRWACDITSPVCVPNCGDALLPMSQTVTPSHLQRGAPGSRTLTTSVLLTQTTSGFTSGNHLQSPSGSLSSNAGDKASAFESE